jgi:hypothetical protein
MAFSFQKLEMYARREGISLRDAARRFQKKGARVRREKARQCACIEEKRAQGRYWWRDQEDAA